MPDIIGTQDADSLLGSDGPDSIDARGGNDRASGDSGDDLIVGRNGDDFLTGDGRFAVPPGGAFGTSGDDTVVGGAGNDTIFGDAFYIANDTGDRAGSNLLRGGAGADSVTGGYGADTIHGGSGDDFIRGYGGAVPSFSGSVFARNADFGDLLLGGSGNDTIDGGGGADTIRGGTGADSLVGGVGNDLLAGGKGADTFSFGISGVTRQPDTGQGRGNRDVVLDFHTGEDRLDLSGFEGAAVRWMYDGARDETVVRIANRSGGPSAPELEIELRGVRHLSGDDIIV